jgi:protein-tyrosine phosphatase
MDLVDLHAHVLPGIDDGPADLDGAVALAAAAAAAGVTTMAATPHVRADHPAVRPGELASRTQTLQERLRAEGIPLRVVPAGEVDLYWAAEADADALRLVSYGQRGTDVLVETPYGELPPVFETLMFRLTAQGYRLLLSHPERSPTFQREPQRLAALAERGTLLQVTASALAGTNRRSRTERLARDLVREGVAHVIASDAHGANIVRATLRDGVLAAARLAPARAEWMATEVPAAILAGEPLPPAPTETGRRRWLGPRR